MASYSFNPLISNKNQQGVVSHNVTLPFTLKKYLKAKEELWKLKYFTIAKNIYLIFKKKKNPLKENENPSRYYYYNSIIN